MIHFPKARKVEIYRQINKFSGDTVSGILALVFINSIHKSQKCYSSKFPPRSGTQCQADGLTGHNVGSTRGFAEEIEDYIVIANGILI